MRNVIMLMVSIVIANICLAQAPQRPNLLNRGSLRRPVSAAEQKFRNTYPAGTNEFGRTWAVQCEYEKFMKENPSGKNGFGRSFDEQRKYEADVKEAQEKEVAAAREELQGWPKVIGLYPFILSVNGTNVLQTVNGCLDGEIGRHWVNDDTTTFDLSSLLEKEYHIVVARGGGRNWECGKGTSLILEPQLGANFWHKYDETGRLVKVGGWAQYAEYDFLTNRRAIVSNRLRAEWAKKHGLTLPQAEKRAQELIEVIDTSTTGDRRDGRAARLRMRAQLAQEERAKATAGASEREAERQSKAEAEKAQRDAERAEQRQQLQAIREKLNRGREAKAAAEMAK